MKNTLENTEGAIKNEHSRETGNIGYKRRRNKLHYTQTNTNNVNKTLALLQPTGGKDEQNIFLCEIVTDTTTRNSEVPKEHRIQFVYYLINFSPEVQPQNHS
jgi:hypothetical protein